MGLYTIHTDNEALVAVLRHMITREPMANKLLRTLALLCLRENIVLRVEHIPGVENVRADLLSRLQVDRFLAVSEVTEREATDIPAILSLEAIRTMLLDSSHCQ